MIWGIFTKLFTNLLTEGKSLKSVNNSLPKVCLRKRQFLKKVLLYSEQLWWDKSMFTVSANLSYWKWLMTWKYSATT